MRKSECIWIELPDKERVKLLCEEYQHFINDQEKLKPLISKLKEINKLPDHFKCEGLENKENLNKLVLNLLKYHYDPAYEKSIQKNFTKVQNARKMNIKNLKNYSDIAAEEFKRLG